MPPAVPRKFKGEKSKLVIGDNNVIREHVTMNPGTEGGGLLTKVGNNCLFAGFASHVAHDCKLDDHVILANLLSTLGRATSKSATIRLSAVLPRCINSCASAHARHHRRPPMSGVEHGVDPLRLGDG